MERSWRTLGPRIAAWVRQSSSIRRTSRPLAGNQGRTRGERTYFEIDRRTRDGIVIMINGSTEWVDGDGFTSGAEPLLEEIEAAYAAAY